MVIYVSQIIPSYIEAKPFPFNLLLSDSSFDFLLSNIFYSFDKKLAFSQGFSHFHDIVILSLNDHKATPTREYF